MMPAFPPRRRLQGKEASISSASSRPSTRISAPDPLCMQCRSEEMRSSRLLIEPFSSPLIPKGSADWTNRDMLSSSRSYTASRLTG